MVEGFPPIEDLSKQGSKDLEEAAGTMAALKRAKGQDSGKWEKISKAAKPTEAAEPTIVIPRFDKEDGHKLTPGEQVEALGQKVRVPKFSKEDGHELTPKERVDETKKKYKHIIIKPESD